MLSQETESAANTTVYGLFAARAKLGRSQLALVEGSRELSYGSLLDRVNRLANWLHANNVARGDRIALWSRNRIEYLEVELAAAATGAIVACLNWRLADLELEHCISLVSPKLMISDEAAVPVADRLSIDLPQCLVMGGDYERALSGASNEEPQVTAGPSDGLVILYTSGTTGLPKGALITQRAMVARALVFASELALKTDAAFPAWAPMFHMASTDHSLATLMRGGVVAVIDGFDPAPMIAAAERFEIGWYPLIPGMVDEFVEALPRSGFEPRYIQVCGAMADLVAPSAIAKASAALKAPYLNSFGATETGLPPATRSTIPPGLVPTSLSKIQSAFCEVRLVDLEGNCVSDGNPGEVAVRGPTLFSGYWNAPETNARDFRNGWFRMGDVMRRNEDGTLDFVDRAKYMIKTGGENVYPAEIERVILSDPRVSDAAVVKSHDAKWGEASVAFVASSDQALTSDDLMLKCREELAGYKRPREIRFIDVNEFPRSTSGKIQRHELEARLQREQTG